MTSMSLGGKATTEATWATGPRPPYPPAIEGVGVPRLVQGSVASSPRRRGDEVVAAIARRDQWRAENVPPRLRAETVSPTTECQQVDRISRSNPGDNSIPKGGVLNQGDSEVLPPRAGSVHELGRFEFGLDSGGWPSIEQGIFMGRGS